MQRKAIPGDAQLLEHQASLQGPDVEIPALEGALLATRLEAVQKRLLSRASFDAGLALSHAMTELQPAVAAKGAVDKGLQERAAIAAQQLFSALQRETSDEHNFQIVPSMVATNGTTSENPYTHEVRATTLLVFWEQTHNIRSWLETLPALLREARWSDAYRGYRSLLDGLDLWVADQLRKKGKGTPEEAHGNAQQHYAQLRTGLEQIADKHAKRLPALFHPDAKTVESEKAAGRPAADTIPMNVYVWKDEQTGKHHLYDLTTPSHPQEQTVDGPLTSDVLNTFFEEVARYPEGEVRYVLPGGAAGAARTTGKIKWYEWIGYAGLVVAGVGLALLTGGASIAATVCFAAGAVAGGLSAGGHLANTAHLNTATTASVVLDVAQIAASFASFGAMSVTVKAGSLAAAISGSRYFVPLISAAGIADGVQLVALTDITFTELSKIQNGPGSAEDKQRAMAVILTQLIVVGGLAALSVQNARNIRALSKTPLELIDQNGVKVLRVAGESTSEPVPHRESSTNASDAPTASGNAPNAPRTTESQPSAKPHTPGSAESGAPPHPSPSPTDAEHWLADLERSLDAAERAKLAKMKAGKTPQQTRDMLGSDRGTARERVRTELRLEHERMAVAAQSKERAAQLRKQIAERGWMNDPDIQQLFTRSELANPNELLPQLRDKLISKTMRAETERAHPGRQVFDGVKIYERMPEADLSEWKANNPDKNASGFTNRQDGLYLQRGEIDLLVVEPQAGTKSTIIAREEIKTGVRDSSSDARRQLNEQTALFRDAASGKKSLRIEFRGLDLSDQIELATDATASKHTRGPASKGFDQSLGITASDLEALCKELITHALPTEGTLP